MLAAFQEFGIGLPEKIYLYGVIDSRHLIILCNYCRCQDMVAAVQADLQVIFHIIKQLLGTDHLGADGNSRIQ